MDMFDAYFRRADLNGDGQIDGNEAIAFFQGSNLPKQVLAKIWAFADKNRTGFLGREEFYNALKLVTVAQSKRELTPDIVNSALYGPASSKIPVPQIKIPGAPASQLNVGDEATLASQTGVDVARSPQSPALRGPAVSVSNLSITQPYSLSVNQSVRPLQPMPVVTTRPAQGALSQGFSTRGPIYMNSHSSEMTGGVAAGMVMQASDRGSSPSLQAGIISQVPGSMTSLPPRTSPSSGIATSTSSSVDLKSPVSQNGYATKSLFGRDAFAPALYQPKRDTVGHSSFTGGILNVSDDGHRAELSSSAGGVANSSEPIPASAGNQSFLRQASLDSLPNSPKVQPGGMGLQQQSVPKQNQQVAAQSVSSVPGVSPQIAASSQSQPQWPRMSQSDIQKYTKVFMAVDTDKDGKISGEQARNLFLSWRLPREVLKQVWDLSDQDNDTMLSLREFCIALYLMERYREGCSLPSVLPSNIMYDLPAARQPTGGYGNTAWAYSPGVQQRQSSSSSGTRQTARPSGRPPLPIPATNPGERMLPKQQKAKIPELDKHLVDQISEEEQKSLNSKFQEATEANKKVEELEKDIKESREKMEFYRVKMQELVLYKSRCDNRLNEITERASADKSEVESLSKTYEEKYRRAGDVASKLTIEEATFRDVQEKKMELYRAIVKLEQEGGNDESLKNRIECIRSDLEELVKSLNERCKKYGLRAKPTTLLELPFGWQPGVQEGAADWDEYWDKFEEEGFTYVKELTIEVQNVVASPKTKFKLARKKSGSVDDSKQPAGSAEVEGITEMRGSTGEQSAEPDAKIGKASDVVERMDENGSAHDRSEDIFVKSTVGSPAAKSSHASPLDEYKDKSALADASPHDKEANRHHVDKTFDEASSGTFDTDDLDSGWGFNQEASHGKHTDDDLFGPGGLALNPIRTGPTGSSLLGDNFMKKSSLFADSVPGTPLVNASYSPQKHGEGPEERGFDSSRFDSFRSTESGFPPRELSRFDSMRSSADFDLRDGGSGFPSFDDSGPFGTGPFKSTFGSETPRSEFGGPFRSTFGSETPRSEFGESFRPTFSSETPRSEYGGPFTSTFEGETPRSDFGGPFTSAFGSETPRSEFGGPFRSLFGSETPRSEYDAFGSVGPFKSSFGSETPRGDSDIGYGGSFKSSLGSETPRTGEDPFGTVGPFRPSLGDETPRRDSDPFGITEPFKSSFIKETPRGTENWSAF